MSAYYSIDGESPAFMGSVTGWGEAGEWIDGLDHSRYPLLVQFREHGIAEPASQLADEILTALVDEPPSDDVRGVVEELMTGCEDAGDAPVIFTYGEVPVSDEDGDWFSGDSSDDPDPHQSATLALLDYLIQCKEDGTDPAAGLDRFAELGADEDELTAALGDDADTFADVSNEKRDESGKWTSGGGKSDSLPTPNTSKNRLSIAHALRRAVWKASGGDTKDYCVVAANVLQTAYPEAEIWYGYYEGSDEQAHTIARLGGKYIDVTADQFGGPKIRIWKELPEEYENYNMEDVPPKQEKNLSDHEKAILKDFRKRLTESGQEKSKSSLSANSDDTETFADWDESKHPRDDKGRYVSRDAIHDAKTDPKKAAELRARVTNPEQRAKLDKALTGEHDLGRTKRGQQRSEAAARRQAKEASAAKAKEILARIHTSGVDPADIEELAAHLPALPVARLRLARQALMASWGGERLRKSGMVDRLVAHVRERAEAEKTDTRPERDAAVTKWKDAGKEESGESGLSDSDFDAAVQTAARSTKRGFGDNKVFIGDVRRAVGKHGVGAKEFDRRLVESARRGGVRMEPADLVSAMDADDIAESQTEMLPGYYAHFLLTEPDPERKHTPRAEPLRSLPPHAPAHVVQKARHLVRASDPRHRADFEAGPHGDEAAARVHRSSVREALAAGKPVPPEVLQDYPDLASPPEPTPASEKPTDSPESASTVVDKSTTVDNTTGAGSQVASPKPEGGKMENATAKELDLLPGEERLANGSLKIGSNIIAADAPASYVESVRKRHAATTSAATARNNRVSGRQVSVSEVPGASEKQIEYYNNLVQQSAVPESADARGLAKHFIANSIPKPTTKAEVSAAIDILKDPMSLARIDKPRYDSLIKTLADRVGSKTEKVKEALAKNPVDNISNNWHQVYEETVHPMLFPAVSEGK